MRVGEIYSEGDISLKIAGQTQGDILHFNGTIWLRLAAGTSGQKLETQGAGANPQWADVADLDISGQTTGDMLYYNGANWVRLAGGTSGDILTANGAGVAPTYQAPAAGGGGLSNVIFSATSGVSDTDYSTYGLGQIVSTADSSPLNMDNLIWYTGTTERTFVRFKYKHSSDITTITWYARSWRVTGSTELGRVRCTIGSLETSTTHSLTGPSWISNTITVSGLVGGTVYDAFFSHKMDSGGGASKQYTQAVMCIAS